MKKYMLISICLLITSTVFSQTENAVDRKSSHEQMKAQRMEMRKLEAIATAKLVDSLVNNRRFVLEAEYLSNQTGNRVVVNSLLNFIIVDSSKIVLQIATTSGSGGPNGMGGITTDGRITSFEVKKAGKKEGFYSIRIMAMTPMGTYDIFLTIRPDSSADATLSGLTYGKLNYHGQIKDRKDAKIFKGRSI
jgi:hypothetical protein